MTTLVNHIIRLDTFITTTRIWNQPTSHCGYSNGDESLTDALEMYITYNKLAFGQTRFPAAADPIEHISEENFLLQIFAKMETFYDLTSPN